MHPYDTPFARGSPLQSFVVDAPGDYRFWTDGYPDTQVAIVPDYTTGHEATLLIAGVAQFVTIGCSTPTTRYATFLPPNGILTTVADLAQVDLAQLGLPLPIQRNIYEGRRPDTQSCTVIFNEQPLDDAIGWSGASFEWGMNGSGPSNLARAMLRYEYGPAIAERYQRRFFTDVTARLPRETYGIEWVLSSAAIRTWLTFVRLVEQARGGLADVPQG